MLVVREGGRRIRSRAKGRKDGTRSLIQGKKRQNAGIPVATDRKVKML